jgi:aryl-alcohol dehydrogenase-like predicted oxidoreductase
VSVREIEEATRIVPIVSVQNRWNPQDRGPERNGVLASCEKLGIAFLPFSPFGGARGARSLGSMGKLAAEATKRGLSPHRLVLSWMLAKSPVVIPIPGVRRVESAKDSALAAEVTLSAEDVKAVEATF